MTPMNIKRLISNKEAEAVVPLLLLLMEYLDSGSIINAIGFAIPHATK